MSLNSPRVPKYRHHKGSGQAFVQLNGRRQYLGKYGTEGNARTYINGICDAIRRVFKWGASQDLIPSTIFQALQKETG